MAIVATPNSSWLLARGHDQHSRQPSFAPVSARPVVTHISYSLRWNNEHKCFETCRIFGIDKSTKQYPCDPEVAHAILCHCADEETQSRFFLKKYPKKDDREIYSANGHLFSISISSASRGKYFGEAAVSLSFYSQDFMVQHIYLHDGMVGTFGKSLNGLNSEDIAARMR